MGCHTWFYQRIERDIEEAAELALKELNQNVMFLKEMILDDFYEDDIELNKSLIETNKCLIDRIEDYLVIENLPRYKYIMEETEANLVEEIIWEYQPENINEYISEKGYFVEVDDFHDVFRKYGYPDDKLFSLEETLAYINNPKNECILYEKSIEHLKEFWEKYPDGMINFG